MLCVASERPAGELPTGKQASAESGNDARALAGVAGVSFRVLKGSVHSGGQAGETRLVGSRRISRAPSRGCSCAPGCGQRSGGHLPSVDWATRLVHKRPGSRAPASVCRIPRRRFVAGHIASTSGAARRVSRGMGMYRSLTGSGRKVPERSSSRSPSRNFCTPSSCSM